MIHQEGSLRIDDTSTNTLVATGDVLFYEGQTVKSWRDGSIIWSYQSELKPYALNDFYGHIIYQQGTKGEIEVLNREGHLQGHIAGNKNLHNVVVVPEGLLLSERRSGEELVWMRLSKDLSAKDTVFQGSGMNLRYYRGYLFDMFLGIKCWDYEREVVVWQNDVEGYLKKNGRVHELYFYEEVVVAVFDHWLVAFDIHSGVLRWERAFDPGGFFQWGFVEEGVLYIYDGWMYFRKIAMLTGEILLEREQRLPCTNPSNGRAAHLPDFVLTNVLNIGRYFVQGTQFHSYIYFIEKETGELAYLERMTEKLPEIKRGLRFIDGRLYVQFKYKAYQELVWYKLG